MPTVVTHALVGAAMVPRGATPVSRVRVGVALAGLSVLPDLDVLAFVVGIPYEHPLGHRGLSHSIAFAFVAAVAVARFGLGLRLRAPGCWRWVALLTLAAASHGLLDAMTDGGLGVGFFLPFVDERYFLPFRPLRVSPIGLSAFVRGPALAVLGSEILYVWLPLGALWLASRLRRRG